MVRVVSELLQQRFVADRVESGLRADIFVTVCCELFEVIRGQRGMCRSRGADRD